MARNLDGMWDLVVVGHGLTGLAATVAYLAERRGTPPRVAVIDRAPVGDHGRPAQTHPADVPSTVEFHVLTDDTTLRRAPTEAAARRAALFERASKLGACFFVGIELVGLERSPGGGITGVRVRSTVGETVMSTDTVLLAPGGLDRELDEFERVIHAGARGDGRPEAALLGPGSAMSAAAAIGAVVTEQPGGHRMFPIDPRSDQAMPIVATWLCGVLVGLDGRRFIDEAELAFELQADAVARAVLARGGLAFALTDASVRAATPLSATLRNTDQPAITADSLGELADRLGMDSVILEGTIGEYNAAIVAASSGRPGPTASRTASLWPPKSTWALPLTDPPFEALPVGVQVTSMREGLCVDDTMRVVDDRGESIPGLYAAGDVVSAYHGSHSPDGSPPQDTVAVGRLAGMAAATVMMK